MNKATPLFILGAPRSGTTFLSSLLKRTEYGVPFETHFITKYFKKLSQYGDLKNLAAIGRLVKDILTERAVMQWNLQIDVDEFCLSLPENTTYADIVNRLCLLHAANMGYSNWGDKTPHYLDDLNVLVSLFPNSKYVTIVRDGRDVALSLLGRDWGPNNVYCCAKYWANLNRDQPILQKLEDKQQLIRVRYEELLDDVEVESRRIIAFLGVDPNTANPSGSDHNVMKGNYGKWRNSMSARQIQVFEYVAGETLTRLGYETVSEARHVSPMHSYVYYVHNFFMKCRHLFKINVIDGFKIRFLGKQPFAE